MGQELNDYNLDYEECVCIYVCVCVYVCVYTHTYTFHIFIFFHIIYLCISKQ